MALQIIGSGFGRTGTRSLKDALERLGFGPCHHMMEIFPNPAQVDHWTAVAAGQPVDWEVVFAGYESQVDWPGAHVWRALAETFPDAKVIHTHRPPEAWWPSFSRTIGKLMQVHDQIDLPPHAAKMMQACRDMIMQETFGMASPDEATAKAAYARRYADVTEAISPDRLLIYDAVQGWEPLCAFLGVPVPDTPFPHMNTRATFWENLGGEPA